MMPPLLTKRWNTEYTLGRYESDKSVDFIYDIKKYAPLRGCGLYVGCGNGRNFIPLYEDGLNLTGIDVSMVAINQLLVKKPGLEGRLVCTAFEHYNAQKPFDYLIAIQVFQHGTFDSIRANFTKVKELLVKGGLFFLRINSSNTTIYHEHTILSTTEFGITIRYESGPKCGLVLSFFTRNGLIKMLKEFDLISINERVHSRTLPKTGTWSQWEIIVRKKCE